MSVMSGSRSVIFRFFVMLVIFRYVKVKPSLLWVEIRDGRRML